MRRVLRDSECGCSRPDHPSAHNGTNEGAVVQPGWYAAAAGSSVAYSTQQYSTVLYSTLQYSTVLYSALQYSTVLYSTLQYSSPDGTHSGHRRQRGVALHVCAQP
jgi:hypothetical protein